MGEVHHQNKAISSTILLAILNDLEWDRKEARSSKLRNELEYVACTLVITFGATLHGKEVTLVTMNGMLSTWLECTTTLLHPHIMASIHRWFKADTGFWWHHHRKCKQSPCKIWIACSFDNDYSLRTGRSAGFSCLYGTHKKFTEYAPFLLEYLGRAQASNPIIMSSLADLQNLASGDLLTVGQLLKQQKEESLA